MGTKRGPITKLRMSTSRLGKKHPRRTGRPRLTPVTVGFDALMSARLRALAAGDRVSALCKRLIVDGAQVMWDRRNDAGQRVDPRSWR